MREREGEVILLEGLHPIRIQHFENGGGEGLEVSYKGPGFEQMEIPSNLLKSEN